MQARESSIPVFEDLLFWSAVGNFRVFIPDTNSRGFSTADRLKSKAPKETDLSCKMSDPNSGFKTLNRLKFILRDDFKISDISNPAGRFSHTFFSRGLESEMRDVLAVESQVLWNLVTRNLMKGHSFKHHLQLIFCSTQGSRVYALCTITWERLRNWFILEGLIYPDQLALQQDADLYSTQKSYVESLYDCILNHIERNEPLPQTSDLAKLLGINERALKSIFKHEFGTSVYQFYLSEKLRRARLLIEHSSIPLYKIALDLGYGDYSTFFRAFYKKYGFSPSDLKRWDRGVE